MELKSITDVLQEILDVADDSYLLFEGNHIVYASKAVTSIWHCTPEEITDNNDIFWESFEHNDLGQLRKNWATKIPFKQTCRIRSHHSESTSLWIELSARRTNTNRVMVRVRNVSEWLAREAESRSIYEEVIHLNENLSNHQEELKASMEELREANHQLQFNRNQLEFIIGNASEAICTLDSFGRITMMNHAGNELLQLSPHKVQLHYLVNFLAREYRKELAGFIVGHQINTLPVWSKETSPQICYLEVVMRNTKGDEFPAKLSLSRINTPSENYFIAVITDLTEVKRAQQALVETEKLIRKIAESMPDLLFLYDVNANSFTFQNEHLNDFFGENAKYFNPFRLEKIAELVHKDDMDVLERAVSQVVGGRIGMVEAEFRLRSGDGYKWVQLRHAVFSKDSERVTRILGILQDIDDRKHREMELNQAKKEAEQAVTAKSQFLSTMSHEIRTPMNAVIGMANLLMHEVNNPQQLDKIKILKFAADNLMVILNDVLDFNKLESGKVELELLTLNLKELLSGLEQLFQPKAQEKSLLLKLELDARAPLYVIGDSVRLSQVLSNLLSNAIKFTERGEVCLRTELLTLQHDTATIRFQVRDTGIGIPAEQQKRIFERFAQGSPDISKKYGGTGLGLAISKLLVEAQGGRLIVDSQEGKGSSFSFVLTFPLASEQQTTVLNTEENSSVFSQDLSGCKILIAEDNHVNQLVVAQYLQNWKADFTFAETGAQVYEKLANETYDLILLDLQLPDTDGYAIAENIRKKEGKYAAQLPILAFSAEAGQEMIDKVQRSGMNGYVPKPFKPNELFEKLANHLGISALHIGDGVEDTTDQVTHRADGAEGELISLAPFIAQIGQEEFMHDFIRLNLESLEQFPVDYRTAIETRNSEMLSHTVHRMQSNISLLQFHTLAQELARYRNGKEIWKKLTPSQLQEHLAQVENLCYRAGVILKRASGK